MQSRNVAIARTPNMRLVRRQLIHASYALLALCVIVCPTTKATPTPILNTSVLVLRLAAGATSGSGILSTLYWDEIDVPNAYNVRQQIYGTGPNNECTLAAGTSTYWIYDHDGFPSNSADGRLALTICFPEAPGSIATLGDFYVTDYGKTIAMLSWTGVVAFTPKLLYIDAGGERLPNSGVHQVATVNGTTFYVAGTAAYDYGFQYVPLDNPAYVEVVSGAIPGQPGYFDSRAVAIYNGQLYGVDSTLDSGWGGIFKLGAGMPVATASTAATLLPGFTGTASLWTIVFQSTVSVWAATDGIAGALGGVVGYTWNAGTSSWSQTVTKAFDISHGMYSITGRDEAGHYVLYGCTASILYRWDTTLIADPAATIYDVTTAAPGGSLRGVVIAPMSPTPSPTTTSTATSTASL